MLKSINFRWIKIFEYHPWHCWSQSGPRTCIIGYKYIWVPKLWGILDPKYPKNVIFVFAVLSISIFVLVFVFGVLEKSNICTFPNDIWICIGICWFQNEFPNYFPCTETTNTKQRGQESKQHIHIISCWGSSVTKMSPKYIGQATWGLLERYWR